MLKYKFLKKNNITGDSKLLNSCVSLKETSVVQIPSNLNPSVGGESRMLILTHSELNYCICVKGEQEMFVQVSLRLDCVRLQNCCSTFKIQDE